MPGSQVKTVSDVRVHLRHVTQPCLQGIQGGGGTLGGVGVRRGVRRGVGCELRRRVGGDAITELP